MSGETQYFSGGDWAMSEPNASPCLFLSHSGADTDAARELKRRLLDSPDARATGLRVWLDKDDSSREVISPVSESAFCVRTALPARGQSCVAWTIHGTRG